MSEDEDLFYSSEDGSDFDAYIDEEDICHACNSNGKRDYEAVFNVQYKSFTPEQLRTEMGREIEGLESVLSVEHELAITFLQRYHWNKDRAIEAYTEVPTCVLNTVEEPSNKRESADGPYLGIAHRLKRLQSSAVTPTPESCGVCFDDITDASDILESKCGHRFCRKCWEAYLTCKIKEEGQCSIHCMEARCQDELKRSFIQSIVEREVFDRWQSLLEQSYVSASPSLKFCPAPSCRSVVRCSVGRSDLSTTVPTVICAEGHYFCFGCELDNGHIPVSCKIAELWFGSKEDTGTTQWIQANTRKCPKCNNSIEKNGGCNRMLCRHCNFQFCWMCMKSWSMHGYNDSVCNAYAEPSRTEKMDAARVSLERWMFYYDRFNNHEASARLDQELVDAAQAKMQEIQEQSSLTWIEARFMQHAVDELTRCRQTLKWTYAMAHFLVSGNTKQLFEDIQADLERAVEQLSQLIDTPLEESDILALRQRVVDKTVYVQKRHEVMIVDIAKGLLENQWEWTVSIE